MRWAEHVARMGEGRDVHRVLVGKPEGTRECCVLSGRGLCDRLITRAEESYRLWRVVDDQETSKTRKLKPATGL
jgi:hypothetical protein